MRRWLTTATLLLSLSGTALSQPPTPAGTREMMRHLEAAFAFDIHMRRDVDESFSAEGIKVVAHDIGEGKVYERHGVTVTAFRVSHGRVEPGVSYGYRVDYAGRSVAISGDTSPSDSLVAACRASTC